MATPRKTATKAEQLRVSQIGDFKSRMSGLQELPSGLVVKVRNPGGLTAFIANGTIPNSLLGIVQTTLDTNATREELASKAGDMAKDMSAISDMMQLMNIVTAQVVVEPKVYLAPTDEDVQRYNLLNPNSPVSTPEDLREDDRLYVDEIEDMDKRFLFQWVTGGTRDLEKFRQQHERDVALVSAKQGSENSALSPTGSDNGKL